MNDVSVSVSISGYDSPGFHSLIGAIAVSVDGERLDQYSNDPSQAESDRSETVPDRGQLLYHDFENWLDTLERLFAEDTEPYEYVRTRIEGLTSYYVCQPLDLTGRAIRLAFHGNPNVPGVDDEARELPSPKCARGYVVERHELTREFVAAGREMVEYDRAHVAANPEFANRRPDGDDPDRGAFRSRLDELAAANEPGTVE